MTTLRDLGIDTPPGARGWVKTLCPKCSHTRRKHARERCLAVEVDRGLYHCHHCGWKGGTESDWRDTLAAPRLGSEHRAPTRTWVKPEPLEIETLHPATLKWFTEVRHIDPAVLDRMGIVSNLTTIWFPYVRDGELVTWKERHQGKKFFMAKDAERIMYNLDNCRDAEQIVIVEGELDALAVMTAGIDAVLSVPNGAGGNLDYLESASDIIDHAHTIVLAVDGDEPGQKLQQELTRRIGKEKCYRVQWPEGIKDANELLIRDGPAPLLKALIDARPFPIDGVVAPLEIEEDVLALYREGAKGGLSTGWKSMDTHYTVVAGQLTIVTGIPGSGKSEFLDALMINLAKAHEWKFAVFSPENHPLQRHVQKLLEKWSGLPFNEGATSRMPEDLVRKGLGFLDDHIRFLAPESPTLDGLLEMTAMLTLRMGINGMILDPWNEIEHLRPAAMTETEYISQALTKIRRFARHYRLHIWVMAHPAKMQKEKDGAIPVPTPYDISGSAAWFNKADNCLTVSRDKADPLKPVDIHVQKIRFREVGQLGLVQLNYNRVNGRYQEEPLSYSRRTG